MSTNKHEWVVAILKGGEEFYLDLKNERDIGLGKKFRKKGLIKKITKPTQEQLKVIEEWEKMIKGGLI